MSAIIVRNSNSFAISHFPIRKYPPKNYFGTKFSEYRHHFLPSSQLPTLSKHEFYEDYEISASYQYRRTPFTNSSGKWWSSLNNSKSRKRFISTRRWIEPIHHTCHTVSPRGNDGSLCTCERNTRASSVEKRFWHESNLVSSRANFSKSKRTYYY